MAQLNYTPKEVAALISCSPEHVRRLCECGAINARLMPTTGTIRKRYVIPAVELKRLGFLDEQSNRFTGQSIRALEDKVNTIMKAQFANL